MEHELQCNRVRSIFFYNMLKLCEAGDEVERHLVHCKNAFLESSKTYVNQEKKISANGVSNTDLVRTLENNKYLVTKNILLGF